MSTPRSIPPSAAAAIGAALSAAGILDVVTVAAPCHGDDPLVAALAADGMRHLTVRPEAGAALASGFTHASGRLTALILPAHSELASALPAIIDAAASRIPLLVIATQPRNLTDLALAEMTRLCSSGALIQHVPDAWHHDGAITDAITGAAHLAAEQHRPVLLTIATDEPEAGPTASRPAAAHPQVARPEEVRWEEVRWGPPAAPVASPAAVEDLARLLGHARRPVFIAGRGATREPGALERLADQAGALLATSAAARGLFTGNPWHVGIAGVLAPPAMADLLAAADVVISWGCSLDAWTTRHGTLLAPQARLAQIDIDPAALGLHHRIDVGVAGDACRTAEALQQVLPRQSGYRSAPVRERIAEHGHWQDVGYQPVLECEDRIDPRTLTLLLDAGLPDERTLTVEQSAAMGHPLSYLRVPDTSGFRLAAPGFALASGIGAALARADRLAVTTLDLDGVLAAAADLASAARLRARLLILVYDEQILTGAPQHAIDLTQIAAGHGCAGAVIRRPADLSVLSGWLAQPIPQPLLLQAPVAHIRWWLDPLHGTADPPMKAP